MRKFLGSILVVSGIVLGSIYFINNYVSTEIEKILLEKLKENPDLDIRYGKVNFTIIPLKLTFDTVILKQEDSCSCGKIRSIGYLIGIRVGDR